jgi:hypothetical protein
VFSRKRQEFLLPAALAKAVMPSTDHGFDLACWQVQSMTTAVNPLTHLAIGKSTRSGRSRHVCGTHLKNLTTASDEMRPAVILYISILGHAFGIADTLGRGIEALGEHLQGLELLFAEELVRSNWRLGWACRGRRRNDVKEFSLLF